LTHVVLDDIPRATPQDDYTVSLTASDGAGGTASKRVVTVRTSRRPLKLVTDYWQSPSDPVTLRSTTFQDPGTLDTFVYSYDWNGDGILT